MNGDRNPVYTCLAGKETILKLNSSTVAETGAQPSQLKKGEQPLQSLPSF
jgi:hypothetical protein